MKNIKLKFIILTIFSLFSLTGCLTDNTTDEEKEFIEQCNAKPGCKYKVLSAECVCDKTHDYIPAP
jgi:hypothetical protein